MTWKPDWPGGAGLRLGLVLPTVEGWLGPGRTARWSDLREIAGVAEGAGFAALWVADHFLYRNTPTRQMVPEGESRGLWEAYTLLGALAAATSKIHVGPLVACTTFRNPALLAKMADTLDEVSDGRSVLGLGAGWVEDEHLAFGFPYGSPADRVGRFEEALAIIGPLLREGRVDFQGIHYTARDCELTPRGPTRGGPPMLIGAKGPRMLRLTARWADLHDTDFHLDPSTLPAQTAALDAACRELGRDPATLGRLCAVRVAVLGPDEPNGAGEEMAPGVRRRVFDVAGLPREAIAGRPDDLAAYLKRYRAVGARLVSVQLVRFAGPQSVEALAPVVEALGR